MNYHKINCALVSNGYSTLKSKKERRFALKKAVKANSMTDVMDKLVLLRKHIPDDKLKKLYKSDIDYLKKMYKKKLSKYTMMQYGGLDDVIVEQIEYPEKMESREQIKKNGETESIVTYTVYESHTIDSIEYIFCTLKEIDIPNMLQIDREYISPNTTLTEVTEKFNRTPNQFIGFKANNEFQGYCQFNPLNSEIEIIGFYVNKPYGSTLYKFLEKLFTQHEHNRIYTSVSIRTDYAIRLLNLWYMCGFLTYDISSADQLILMEKFL